MMHVSEALNESVENKNVKEKVHNDLMTIKTGLSISQQDSGSYLV